LVFPRFRAVVFVHGCFWHMHGCPTFKIPGTRHDFWRAKLEGNRARDHDQRSKLAARGWRVGVVWECALAGKRRLGLDEVVGCLQSWLESEESDLDISGHPVDP
jgi:DNA mismatch endonuclease (patch repair protein)